MKPAKIKIIIPYFGCWPEWINLFLQSCRYNSDIDWLFFSDCGETDIKPDNVEFQNITFSDYKTLVSERLNIDFSQAEPYKLCDLKPAYGFLHQDQVEGYDFFGFGDIDVIYGDLRRFIQADILQQYQLISTHQRRVSGHFCLLKNNSQMRLAFQRIPNWRELLENSQHLGIDESKFSKVFMPHRKHPQWLKNVYGWFNPLRRNNYFEEQYSTILSPTRWHNGESKHPQKWLWEKGKLTNSEDGEREFMYLHFMNWKSTKWLHKRHGEQAAWENLPQLVHFNVSNHSDVWQITPNGFSLPAPEHQELRVKDKF